jgi:hypothetical protein
MRKPTILTLLLSGIMLVGCGSGQKTVKDEAAPTTATTTATTEEDFPDEGVTSTTKPPTGRHRVGEAITLEGVDSGDEVLRVQVARVSFSGGDEFNEPERGQFMGAYIKVKALADDQTSLWGDFYVTMRGHHYDADACCPEGFKPELDYVDLNEGETAEGWLIFDVPARHGQVVLGQSFGGGKIATWSF